MTFENDYQIELNIKRNQFGLETNAPIFENRYHIEIELTSAPLIENEFTPLPNDKCDNCRRKNNDSMTVTCKINFHTVNSTDLRVNGSFKFVKRHTVQRQCDYNFCDERNFF